MTAFEILELVGAAIGMILGAIVFLVLFFRGMSWLDVWIQSGRSNQVNRGGGRERDYPRREERHLRVRRRRSNPIASNSLSSPARLRLAQQQAALASSLQDPETLSQSSDKLEVDSVMQSNCVRVGRWGAVHLLSGEIIPNVRILSKEEAELAFREMRLEAGQMSDSLALEDEDHRWLLVRLQSIKMFAWKRESQ